MKVITRNKKNYIIAHGCHQRKHIIDQWCMNCTKFSLDTKGHCDICGFTYVNLYSQIPWGKPC